ncbi:hypothetical protein NQ315_010968, partial [Exocentrus adspersus]
MIRTETGFSTISRDQIAMRWLGSNEWDFLATSGVCGPPQRPAVTTGRGDLWIWWKRPASSVRAFVLRLFLRNRHLKMHYPPEQLIQMVYAIGESDGNCFLAARIYAQKYPNRSHPDVRSLQNLKERFERTGSVSYEKKSKTPTVLNEENQLAISLAVVENPQVSVRVLSNDLNIKKSSISKCLQNNKFHPYHVQLHQELLENDFERRIHFCQWVHNVVAENEDFFFVLFTDECMFHRNGFVNRHNFHCYDSQNPHIVQVNNHQHNWSINVWGGILHNYVIGPYIFQGSVTGKLYFYSILKYKWIQRSLKHARFFEHDGGAGVLESARVIN